MSETWSIETEVGTTTLAHDPPASPVGSSLFVLAHGAGSDMDHRSTLAMSDLFCSLGLHVVRFNFLYREQGRRAPDRMPKLTACFDAVVNDVRRRFEPGMVLIGGRSMGGRVASMMAADAAAGTYDGLILLAYPLHPPGRPDKLRDEHLGRIAAPVLCFNGTRDDFCEVPLMEKVVSTLPDSFAMQFIEGADHGFKVLKRSGRTEADVRSEIADASRAWLAQVSVGE